MDRQNKEMLVGESEGEKKPEKWERMWSLEAGEKEAIMWVRDMGEMK